MLHNMWPLMLGQKPLKCHEKLYGVYKMQQTSGAAGVLPRSPLGELTALPIPPIWWGGAGCPLPKPSPRSRPFRPRASALWASLSPPRIFKPPPK